MDGGGHYTDDDQKRAWQNTLNPKFHPVRLDGNQTRPDPQLAQLHLRAQENGAMWVVYTTQPH